MDQAKQIFRSFDKVNSVQEEMELQKWISESNENMLEYHYLKILWTGRQQNDSTTDESLKEPLLRIKNDVRVLIRRRERNSIIGFIVIIGSLFLLIHYFLFLRPEKLKMNRIVMNFNNEKLSSVIPLLEKKYQIEISIPDNLKDCAISGAFYQHAPTEIIRVIAETHHLRYQQINNYSYTLNGNGCNENANTDLKR